ncbi:hypothetical protein ACWCOR_25175, partial [Promicromonospora sukumoe]
WGRGVDTQSFHPGFRDEAWRRKIGAGREILVGVNTGGPSRRHGSPGDVAPDAATAHGDVGAMSG